MYYLLWRRIIGINTTMCKAYWPLMDDLMQDNVANSKQNEVYNCITVGFI